MLVVLEVGFSEVRVLLLCCSWLMAQEVEDVLVEALPDDGVEGHVPELDHNFLPNEGLNRLGVHALDLDFAVVSVDVLLELVDAAAGLWADLARVLPVDLELLEGPGTRIATPQVLVELPLPVEGPRALGALVALVGPWLGGLARDLGILFSTILLRVIFFQHRVQVRQGSHLLCGEARGHVKEVVVGYL